MEPLTLEPLSSALSKGAPGMTLLEAYSALAKDARRANTAIDVPSAGIISLGDREFDFWHLPLKSVS